MFVSYAQNFEDVILWRALADVQCGFYIDVGASDPEEFSVTKAFYDRGWRGVSVEPLPSCAAALEAARPEDVNICAAVGSSTGLRSIHRIGGLSTMRGEIAERDAQMGFSSTSAPVMVTSLTEICEKYAGTKTIHFLKIDVEGSEKDVLCGMNFDRFRPWILLVEATLPMSSEHVHGDWEDILFKNQYEVVYDDGLNRFYVAKEMIVLKERFVYPPNVFDDFTTIAEVRAEQATISEHSRLEAAEAERGKLTSLIKSYASLAQQLTMSNEVERHRADELTSLIRNYEGLVDQLARTGDLEHELHSTRAQLQDACAKLSELYNSRSYRVTAPLRTVVGALRRKMNERSGAKKSITYLILRLMKIGLQRIFPRS